MPHDKGPVAELLIELRRAPARDDANGEPNGAPGIPIHEQIERALREGIRSGRLPAGEALPSTRGLASQLCVSRGVVTEAYRQLAAEGYLTLRQGAPVRVSSAVRAHREHAPARSLLPSFAYEMHPGLPDLAGFPRDRWLRSLRSALRDSPHAAIGYADPRGVPELREALASYLGRVRGVAAEPEHTLICTGFMQGLSLICRALLGYDVKAVALEDPGWHNHRLIVEQAGLEVLPIPVDEEGIDVEQLAASQASVVVITPSHQFPTGAVLSPQRRAALIEWAESGEHLIVEDDFDGELRYDRGAVGALQGLAPERVVYAGSASKRLAPGMRLGWLLTPSWLSWQLIAMKAIEDGGSETIGQLALADFITRGELDRHLRRMRSVYETRRQALIQALARHLPQARPTGIAAGVFEPVLLPQDVDESALLSTAASAGVGVEGLQLHRFGEGGQPGLVLGYGSLPEPAIERGVALLAEALAQLER
ncbi:MAG TPA: PLP-dependent aminotransferase family protein [Solirubrobacteraceae bacterium]|jgi:GntR family transcriptional regulator/MocR family aminotransferase